MTPTLTISHTPGPWHVPDAPTLYDGDCLLTHQVWGDKRICFIEGQNVGIATAAANASLIAAAPDLLAALKEASDELVLVKGSALRERIDAAIAKAEGR